MPPKKNILITKFTTIIRKLSSILEHHQIKIIVASCTPTVISLLPQSAPPDIRREQAQVTEKLN